MTDLTIETDISRGVYKPVNYIMYNGERYTEHARVEELEDNLKIAVEALKYYADSNNHYGIPTPIIMDDHGGNKAREALSDIER